MQSRRLASLIAPGFLAIVLGVVLVLIENLNGFVSENLSPQTHQIIRDIAEAAFWLMLAWFASRMVDVFLWSSIERRSGRSAPKLLVSVGRLLILIAAIAIIITVVFHQALTGLVVSSGVVGIVLGFALQRMISDFFSGIAMGMEHPFRVGDWIDVDGVAGQVVETNWRATRIVTIEQITVILPNSFIAERRFQNFNLPEPYFRTESKVTMEFSVPPEDARRVLLAAVRATPGVLATPAPDVMLYEFGANGHVFAARYFVSDYRELVPVRDRVNSNIARHLWQAGLAVAYPKRDVFHAEMPHRDLNRKTERDAILSRVELFESLETVELRQLAAALVERECKAGQQVVKQGEAGASLFVIVDGLLEVKVESHGQSKVVGRVGPGEFFGEISMLTGSPRGATVIALTDATLYEISHDVISPILKNRPAVAEAISQSVAIRRTRNSKAMEHVDPVKQATEERSFTDDLLRKMRGFFGLDT